MSISIPMISGQELKKQYNFESVDSFAQKKIKNKKFLHHTTLSSAKLIFREDEQGQCYFYINSVANMNDKNEAKLHQEQGKKVFVLSFSIDTDKSDNIPMWYLYSGIDGQGVRLSFTQDKIFTFLRNLRIFRVKDNKPDLYAGELENGRDYKLSLGYVFYCSTRDVVKVNGSQFKLEGDMADFKNDNFFVKDYAWEYEKEFRIVVEYLGNNPPPKLALSFDRNKMTTAGMRIKFAPELKMDNYEKIDLAEEINLNRCHNIKVWDDEAKKKTLSKIDDSKLTISMDLIKRNQGSILNNMKKVLSDADEDELKEVGKIVRTIVKDKRRKNGNGESSDNNKTDQVPALVE